jgi:predicted Ser/Thr protein kinase
VGDPITGEVAPDERFLRAVEEKIRSPGKQSFRQEVAQAMVACKAGEVHAHHLRMRGRSAVPVRRAPTCCGWRSQRAPGR